MYLEVEANYRSQVQQIAQFPCQPSAQHVQHGENHQKKTGASQMASILTNTSAMVALQNLRTINNNLVDTQNQIATGKKIATAKDNSTV